MTENAPDAGKHRIPFISLVPFLAIAFGIAWGVLALYIFLPGPMAALFGEITGQHPLFFLAVYAPAIAAFAVVMYNAGFGGLRRYLSRLLLWRCSAYWYVFLLLVIPLIFIAGAALKGNLLTELYPFSSFGSFMAALGFTAIKGPVEEFGWRGLALPLLQRRLKPFWAALVLGTIWGLWHLPAFLLSGTPQGGWSFMPFFIGSIALSVIVTPLFNSSRGSILLPMLFHFALNNPVWPDAQPYDICLFAAAAVVVTWLNRKEMFAREGAVTEVVPGA
jgi:hypothetical protein